MVIYGEKVGKKIMLAEFSSTLGLEVSVFVFFSLLCFSRFYYDYVMPFIIKENLSYQIILWEIRLKTFIHPSCVFIFCY